MKRLAALSTALFVLAACDQPTSVAVDDLFALSAIVGTEAGSLGKVTLDTEVINDGDEMLYGDGIPTGQWVTAEVQGIVLGLRATDRKDGLLGVTGTNGNRVGVYEAATGFDEPDENRAEWNYEWSVDLRNAKGNARGTTLSDYSLVLEQDFTEQSLFGALGSDPVQLPMIALVCDEFTDFVCQQSWNPVFGNTDFNMDDEATYNLRLVLTRETFKGLPLAVRIQVNVVNPS